MRENVSSLGPALCCLLEGCLWSHWTPSLLWRLDDDDANLVLWLDLNLCLLICEKGLCWRRTNFYILQFVCQTTFEVLKFKLSVVVSFSFNILWLFSCGLIIGELRSLTFETLTWMLRHAWCCGLMLVAWVLNRFAWFLILLFVCHL